MRATVNDKEVFLKEGELPAVTLSINSLTDPSKISGTTSTTIKVLATPEAKRVFGTEFMQDARNRADLELRMGFGGVDDYRTNVIPV